MKCNSCGRKDRIEWDNEGIPKCWACGSSTKPKEGK